jgi:hypothetical protein
MKRQLPSQTLEEQFLSRSTRKAPLSESIRLGAQLMLQKAVELEVTEFLGREHYGRSGDEPLRGTFCASCRKRRGLGSRSYCKRHSRRRATRPVWSEPKPSWRCMKRSIPKR